MPEGSGPRLRTTRNLRERSVCSGTIGQPQHSWPTTQTPLLQLRERAHESAGDGKRGTCSPLHPKPQSQTPFARSRSLDQSQTPFARSDLATALAAQADVIITGDKDLLTLKTHGGVRIRTPRQFMDAPKA